MKNTGEFTHGRIMFAAAMVVSLVATRAVASPESEARAREESEWLCYRTFVQFLDRVDWMFSSHLPLPDIGHGLQIRLGYPWNYNHDSCYIIDGIDTSLIFTPNVEVPVNKARSTGLISDPVDSWVLPSSVSLHSSNNPSLGISRYGR